MTILRVLIPSWRFFDRLGRVPELLYRVKMKGGGFGPWAPCFEKPKRKTYNLFLNPKGNLYLAYQSLIDRLLDDSQTNEKEFENTVSFGLIKNLVHEIAIKNQDVTHFEFKVNITEFENSKSKITEVFSTHEYPV